LLFSVLRYLLPSAFCLLPSVSLAADTIKVFSTPGKLTFTDLAGRLGGIGTTIISFLVGVALLFIIWGAFKYVRSAGDSEKLRRAESTHLWHFRAFSDAFFLGICYDYQEELVRIKDTNLRILANKKT